ncbi:MAG: LysR family transcriptional regulator [Cellvibrionales bacterium]|nr:LysR family transcriptional regulator [Cellvibrionales bacterium]
MPKSRLHARIGTLRQLEILLAVHDHGSINGAAKALFLTQPSVSMQMKKLAEAIDAPLYHLVHRKLVFTEHGLELVKTAVEVLDSFAKLDMSLRAMNELRSGTLRLAVVNTSQYFIPHLLGPFCERYPGINVQLRIGNRGQTIERLKHGIEDFYVFSHPPHELATERIEFLDNPLVAIAHAGHRLARQKTVSLEEFCAEPFLMREEGSGTRHAIETFMRQQGSRLNVKMTIEGNVAIKHSVMSKLGVSILSEHTLSFGEQAGLATLPVRGLPIDSHWFFLWSKSKRPTVIAAEFLHYVETEGKQALLAELAKN